MFKTWAMIEVSLASLFFSCVSLFSYWVLQTGILTHSTLVRVIKKNKNIFILFFQKNVYQNCSEYNLYWFISNAGLPANISNLCSKNSTDPDCEIYNSEVVPNLATMNIWGSVISLVVLRLFFTMFESFLTPTLSEGISLAFPVWVILNL